MRSKTRSQRFAVEELRARRTRNVKRLAHERACERSSARREHRITVLWRAIVRAERALRLARQRAEHPRKRTVVG
jgi:hypothetical protein